MKTFFAGTAIALVCFVVVGCSEPAPPSEAPERDVRTISGTVKFREHIGLTPESRLELTLQDVSVAAAPALQIATETVENPGQSPIEFTIQYDAELIDATHRYSIDAKVFDRGHLILLSDTIVPVLTDGAAENPRIIVVRVSQSSTTEPDGNSAE